MSSLREGHASLAILPCGDINARDAERVQARDHTNTSADIPSMYVHQYMYNLPSTAALHHPIFQPYSFETVTTRKDVLQLRLRRLDQSACTSFVQHYANAKVIR